MDGLLLAVAMLLFGLSAFVSALRRWRFERRIGRISKANTIPSFLENIEAEQGGQLLASGSSSGRRIAKLRLSLPSAVRRLEPKAPAAAGAGALALAAVLLWLGLGWMTALLFAGATALSADRAVAVLGRARMRKLAEAQLPDALGLIIRSLRAGATIGHAVAEVGHRGLEPLGGVFRRADEAARLGTRLELALFEQARALGIQSFSFFVVAVTVQRDAGGNLAETLANLDQTLRLRQRMQQKANAMASEARASAVILGGLPFFVAALMLWLVPDYIEVLYTTAAGLALLALALLSLGTGVFVMSRLARLRA